LWEADSRISLFKHRLAQMC